MNFMMSLRQGRAVEWTDANPVLRLRELGVESDTRLFKIGDGTTAWNDLTHQGEKIPQPMIPEFMFYGYERYPSRDNSLKWPFKWLWSKK